MRPRRPDARRRCRAGARIGTCSARRTAQMRALRPDLDVRAAARQRADAGRHASPAASSTRSCSRAPAWNGSVWIGTSPRCSRSTECCRRRRRARWPSSAARRRPGSARTAGGARRRADAARRRRRAGAAPRARRRLFGAGRRGGASQTAPTSRCAPASSPSTRRGRIRAERHGTDPVALGDATARRLLELGAGGDPRGVRQDRAPRRAGVRLEVVDELPHPPRPPAAPHRPRCARWSPETRLRAGAARRAAVRARRAAARASRSRSMPGHARLSPDLAARRGRRARRARRRARCCSSAFPTAKDAEGSGAWDPDGPVPQAIRRIKEAVPVADGVGRRLPVRIHRPRPLRRARRRRRRQRRDAAAAGARRGGLRAGRRRRHRAVRHDGRPRRARFAPRSTTPASTRPRSSPTP